MTIEPTRSLHVLRNARQKRLLLGDHCRALLGTLGASIQATREAVPRRPTRGKNFRIDSTSHAGRKGLVEMHEKSGERIIEQRLYQAYGPTGELGSNDVWDRLVAFQVPLFDTRSRKGWGHIDLLGVTADGRPIIVELKREDSTETPLRAAVEGLVNAIAVEECWRELSAELRRMCERNQLGCQVAEIPMPITVVVLAPDGYWLRWHSRGALGRVVDAAARREFRHLRLAFAEAGYPTHLATFDWPYDADPRVRPAEVDW